MGKATGKLTKAEKRLADAVARFSELDQQVQSLMADRLKVPAALRSAWEAAKTERIAAELARQYGHMPGSPETYAKIDETPAGRRQSPIIRLYETGAIDEEQMVAADEIAIVAESIERAVSIRGASLEALVDNSGAARDVLLERLAMVRLEVVYSRWRERLPMPRRLVLDMVLTTRPLVATAKIYGVPWRKARKWLIESLDRWTDIKDMVWRTVDAEEVEAVYARIGCGKLMPPKPRKGLVLDGSEE